MAAQLHLPLRPEQLGRQVQVKPPAVQPCLTVTAMPLWMPLSSAKASMSDALQVLPRRLRPLLKPLPPRLCAQRRVRRYSHAPLLLPLRCNLAGQPLPLMSFHPPLQTAGIAPIAPTPETARPAVTTRPSIAPAPAPETTAPLAPAPAPGAIVAPAILAPAAEGITTPAILAPAPERRPGAPAPERFPVTTTTGAPAPIAAPPTVERQQLPAIVPAKRPVVPAPAPSPEAAQNITIPGGLGECWREVVDGDSDGSERQCRHVAEMAAGAPCCMPKPSHHLKLRPCRSLPAPHLL